MRKGRGKRKSNFGEGELLLFPIVTGSHWPLVPFQFLFYVGPAISNVETIGPVHFFFVFCFLGWFAEMSVAICLLFGSSLWISFPVYFFIFAYVLARRRPVFFSPAAIVTSFPIDAVVLLQIKWRIRFLRKDLPSPLFPLKRPLLYIPSPVLWVLYRAYSGYVK